MDIDPNQQQVQEPEVPLAQQIAQAIKQVMPQPQQQPQQPAPMSEEQMAQIFKRFVPNEELIQGLFSADAQPQIRGAKLREFVQGIVQEAVATAGVYQQLALQQLQEQWQPALTAAQELQRKQTFDEFYNDFPVLKDHEPVVKAVLPTIASAPDLPSDRKEMFKRIATETEKLIKTSRPDFVLNPNGGGNPQGQQQQQSAAPPSLGGGGRGGAPMPGSRGPADLAVTIFD